MPQEFGAHLTGYSLAPHLRATALEGRTGVFSINTSEALRTISVLEGRIVFAGSNDREERLNSVLLRRSLVDLTDLTRAVHAMLQDNRRLGEVLVEQDILSAEEVARALRIQITEIVCRLLTLRSAAITFRHQPVPPQDDIAFRTPLNALIRASFFQVRDVHHIMDEVGGPASVVAPTAAFAAEAARCGLDPRHQELLAMLSEPQELMQLCRNSEVPDFDVCRLVWVLLTVGALSRLA